MRHPRGADAGAVSIVAPAPVAAIVLALVNDDVPGEGLGCGYLWSSGVGERDREGEEGESSCSVRREGLCMVSGERAELEEEEDEVEEDEEEDEGRGVGEETEKGKGEREGEGEEIELCLRGDLSPPGVTAPLILLLLPRLTMLPLLLSLLPPLLLPMLLRLLLGAVVAGACGVCPAEEAMVAVVGEGVDVDVDVAAPERLPRCCGCKLSRR